jgi:hypothetical protein
VAEDYVPPLRSLLWATRVDTEQGPGIQLACDCATTTALVIDGAGQITGSQEIAATCDGCNSVRWITLVTSAGRTAVAEDVITRAELDWVLKRHGGFLNAAELAEEIEANRDSTQYEPGGAYQDPEGDIWVFDPAFGAGSPCWLRPGVDGAFDYVVPRRPLNRLVPVGSPRMLPPGEGEEDDRG